MKRKQNLRTKLIISLFIMAVVIVAALIVLVARHYRNNMEDYYTEKAYDLTEYFVNDISAEQIAKYYSACTEYKASEVTDGIIDHNDALKDEEYEAVRKKLNNALHIYDLKYIYVIVPHGDDYTYIWDGTDVDSAEYCDLGYVDIYYGNAKEKMDAILSGKAPTGAVSDTSEYGYVASSAMIIWNEDKTPAAAVCIDLSLSRINDQIKKIIYALILLAVLIINISLVILFIYMNKIIVQPIDRLVQATDDFADSKDEEGNLHVTTETYESGDEIGKLFKSVIKMETDIISYAENLKTITKEQERIGAELNVATKIQASYLPNIFPAFPDRKEIDIYATMTPAKEVGGDFYDFFFIDDDHLALVMADVSGKGVGAALFMMISKTFINSQSHYDSSPANVLREVNNRLCESNTADMFVTVWLGILELSTGKLRAANGGHEYPMICRNNGKFELFNDPHGFVLGGIDGIDYEEYETVLEPGDKLFVYTDGVPEATNENDELFGTDRALESLNHDTTSDMNELLTRMKWDIDKFVGNAMQFDDITMMGVHYFGPEK